MKLTTFEKAILALVLFLTAVILLGEPPDKDNKQTIAAPPANVRVLPHRQHVPDQSGSCVNEEGRFVPSEGPNIATLGENSATYGPGSKSWTNPSNVTADDGSGAAIANDDSVSVYLKATDFNFGITSNKEVVGIEVLINRRCSGANAADECVRLVVDGAVVGDDKKAIGTWPGSYTTATYGGPTDMWGLAGLTYTQANSHEFGCVLAAAMSDVTDSMEVDWIKIRVYFEAIPDAAGTSASPASAWWYAAKQ